MVKTTKKKNSILKTFYTVETYGARTTAKIFKTETARDKWVAKNLSPKKKKS